MKIISFNIRYNSWNNIDGPNGWPYRKAAVVKMINKERPAAIGLQEALIDQLLYLDSNLPAYKRVGVGRDDGKEGGEFMAIYYDTTRLILDGYQTLWLSETPDVPSKGWDAACYRTATVANFFDRQSRRNFYYVNTHLDHIGQTARAEGVKLIASLFTPSMSAMIVPAIVGGDMNTTILDRALLPFDYVGLKPARELTSNTSHKDTYTGFGKDKPSMIDHFFVRGDIEVERFRTLDGDYGVPYISDHYPIAITIKLSER
jgi:endonuclease/exonuclease/phosphatase family metal-dependent hydrolase